MSQGQIAKTTPSALAPGDSPDDTLVLSNDGHHWLGTFGVLLDALLNDLLPEGPVRAAVTITTEDDEKTTYRGTLTGQSGGRLIFADGYSVPAADILSVAV